MRYLAPLVLLLCLAGSADAQQPYFINQGPVTPLYPPVPCYQPYPVFVPVYPVYQPYPVYRPAYYPPVRAYRPYWR